MWSDIFYTVTVFALSGACIFNSLTCRRLQRRIEALERKQP